MAIPDRTEATADARLIEAWLPIAELGEESTRERRSMTALPPTYYLHVWWARRPLVACRAAILASLLPHDASRKQFLHALGIHGDPIAAKERIRQATLEGVRLGKEAYGYPRAFSYTPSTGELDKLLDKEAQNATVLDPTAGGGSIPFEARRLGLPTIANDLNPVAWLVMRCTTEFPDTYGDKVRERFLELGAVFRDRVCERIAPFYPSEPEESWVPDGYLWARTVTCPYCNGVVPLSPNWRLDNKGTGVRLHPQTGDPAHRHVTFSIVKRTAEQSHGTVKGGAGTCPFPDCGRVIEGNDIKAQAQAGRNVIPEEAGMGEQLYAVVYKEHEITGYTKAGKPKVKKHRGFRAPRPEDDVTEQVREALDAKLPEWEALGIVPDERFPEDGNDTRPIQYGMPLWRDLFSPRQLYGHCTSVEVFQELVEECGGAADLSDLDRAALSYLALAMDKMLNYNCILCRWIPDREVMAGKFDRHDFAIKWSFAEMAPTVTGLGYDWVVEQTGKAIKELMELMPGGKGAEPRLLEEGAGDGDHAPVRILCESGDQLTEVDDASVDAVVIDPPYYDNVMYAELADFFYGWLKRTAGRLYPGVFTDYLTDKEREAVANPAKFGAFKQVRGSGGVKQRAHRDYQERMQAIFAEARRTLKPDGVMTVMFTHKASGAWDALAKGLVEAGFVITASWPINTEAAGSLHIKDKNAAKSTIFLVCRPREAASPDDAVTYWENVEPEVVRVVREKVDGFQRDGIAGVDLYLACFGPALSVFSRHWPMQRGRAAQKPERPKGAQLQVLEDEDWDPYAVRPEDALDAARGAVKDWRMDAIAAVQRDGRLDPVTEFFVLAWDAFQSPEFPADEALKLARVIGVGFDRDLRDKILAVKGGDVILWDSAVRAQKIGAAISPDGPLINVLHSAARIARERNAARARDTLKETGLLDNTDFKRAFESVLRVLPRPGAVEGKSAALTGAMEDARALETLRTLVYRDDEVPPQPHGEQMTLGNEFGQGELRFDGEG